MSRHNSNYSAASGAWLSVAAYLLLTVVKLSLGVFLHTRAIFADGMNNLTDTVNSFVILFGIHYAQKPADDDHRYGHWKAEAIASLAMSFLILFIGVEVLFGSVRALFHPTAMPPRWPAALVGAFSTLVMFFVYRLNTRRAERLHSIGLKAEARDNLADALTSLGTTVVVVLAQFQLPWLDSMMALFIGAIIVKSGIDIFRESAFSLTDGFDETKLDHYAFAIMNNIHSVKMIKSIRGRSYGAYTYLDITILVDGELTVAAGHRITEEVEQLLMDDFDVATVDVHVEPYEEQYIPKQ